MNSLLFRGVSVTDDKINGGRLLSKGDNSATYVYIGQPGLKIGVGYVIGSSEGNAVRSHHIQSGMNIGCNVSTTRNAEVARKFATSGNMEDCYVYTIDSGVFEANGVIAYELEHPSTPSESEVSIRAGDCGAIPEAVIVGKELVRRSV
jgi:hypothetical protein